jgi:hypothetical protein
MAVDEIISKYIVVPLIAVLGIFVVGSFIEALFGIVGAAFALFIAVGGIIYFAKFFR